MVRAGSLYIRGYNARCVIGNNVLIQVRCLADDVHFHGRQRAHMTEVVPANESLMFVV
jgi:hypothetical protein